MKGKKEKMKMALQSEPRSEPKQNMALPPQTPPDQTQAIAKQALHICLWVKEMSLWTISIDHNYAIFLEWLVQAVSKLGKEYWELLF